MPIPADGAQGNGDSDIAWCDPTRLFERYATTDFDLDLDLDSFEPMPAADAGDATVGRDHHYARRLAHRVYRDWGVSECITLYHQVRTRVR